MITSVSGTIPINLRWHHHLTPPRSTYTRPEGEKMEKGSQLVPVLSVEPGRPPGAEGLNHHGCPQLLSPRHVVGKAQGEAWSPWPSPGFSCSRCGWEGLASNERTRPSEQVCSGGSFPGPHPRRPCHSAHDDRSPGRNPRSHPRKQHTKPWCKRPFVLKTPLDLKTVLQQGSGARGGQGGGCPNPNLREGGI